MGDLATRSYEPADATAVTDFFNLLEERAGGHPGWTSDDFAATIATMVRDTATDTRLRFAPDGTLVAAALNCTPPEGGFRADLMGGVHPEWLGRGLGRELFAWQLARVAEIHRELDPERPWEAHASAVQGDEPALRLFQRFGMAPARYWFDMTAPTSSVPSLPVPGAIEVLTYTPEHEARLHAAHMEAFADHWGFQSRDLDEWVAMTVRTADFLPDLSVLAYDGDELAGYVLSYRDAVPGRLYIGQVGTRRPWRRRGLAGALLARVLHDAGKDGIVTAGLGVDADSPTGAVGVYERIGFTIEYRSVTYSAAVK